MATKAQSFAADGRCPNCGSYKRSAHRQGFIVAGTVILVLAVVAGGFFALVAQQAPMQQQAAAGNGLTYVGGQTEDTLMILTGALLIFGGGVLYAGLTRGVVRCANCGFTPATFATPETPSSTVSELEGLIRDLKADLRSEEPRDVAKLFDLGVAYALMYDATGNEVNRRSALKYMTAARESNPGMFGNSFEDGDWKPFGSLMNDVAFRPFLS